MPPVTPSLRRERALLRRGSSAVAGMDEVGRGAIAGPVSVGVVAVSAATTTAPRGLRDSKLLSVERRESLVPLLKKWAEFWAVGHASSAEIDRWGISSALRLAGLRALKQCEPVTDLVLDGRHDWLTAPPNSETESCEWPDVAIPRVHVMVKADQKCSSVAAASVVAKVTRDHMMMERHERFPAYAWNRNKGYGTTDHHEAMARHGFSREHRRSWALKGLTIEN